MTPSNSQPEASGSKADLSAKTPDDSPASPAPAPPDDTQFSDILGAAFWLAARSEPHRTGALGPMADAIIGGIEARQFRLWRKDGAPLAFAVWGLLDSAAEKKLRAREPLSKEELSSGDQAWIITLISPFLPADVILKDLRDNHFQDVTLMTMV